MLTKLINLLRRKTCSICGARMWRAHTHAVEGTVCADCHDQLYAGDRLCAPTAGSTAFERMFEEE